MNIFIGLLLVVCVIGFLVAIFRKGTLVGLQDLNPEKLYQDDEKEKVKKWVETTLTARKINSQFLQEYNKLVQNEEYQDYCKSKKETFQEKDKRIREREINKLNEYLTKKGQAK
jgi:DNA repair photolyase